MNDAIKTRRFSANQTINGYEEVKFYSSNGFEWGIKNTAPDPIKIEFPYAVTKDQP